MKITHAQLVSALAKPGAQIAYDMQADEAHLAHMALGVAGEAGEVVDIIKKHVIYHKDLNYNKLIEELGDLFFYIQGICQALGVDTSQILSHNIEKLTKRYGEKYSDSAAIARVDTEAKE